MDEVLSALIQLNTYNDIQETILVVKLVLKILTLPIIQKISDENVRAEISTFSTLNEYS